jgi:DNA-binding transcriptional regulator LsrR (DeoR family)
MAKRSLKIDYDLLKEDNPLLYRQLIYEIACLFVEKRLNYSQILKEIYKQASDSKSQYHKYYDKSGKDDIRGPWLPRHVEEAIKNHFIRLGDFRENILSKDIKKNIPNANKVSLKIVPDEKSLLRQVCLDLDEILTDKVKALDEEFVIGVSGGLTMKSVAQTLHDIKLLMSWHEVMSDDDKAKVVICSLTSGGTRDNFIALSDTVAANIADELGVKASGLLGPPFFKGKETLSAFKDEVQEHINRVKNAKIILTSVGNVHDDGCLTSKIFNVVDPDHLRGIRKEEKYEYLGDMLYQCYDGYWGDPVPPSQKISEQIFTVIYLSELRQMIKSGTKCIVVAKGYDKGYHALRGLIVKEMVSDLYMDIECAQGLKDASGM